MSLLEGGPMECTYNGHHFKTTDPQEWNEHMDDGEHIDTIETLCSNCKARIVVTLPYVRMDAGGGKASNVPAIKCPDCEQENENEDAKVIKVSKIGTPSGDTET